MGTTKFSQVRFHTLVLLFFFSCRCIARLSFSIVHWYSVLSPCCAIFSSQLLYSPRSPPVHLVFVQTVARYSILQWCQTLRTGSSKRQPPVWHLVSGVLKGTIPFIGVEAALMGWNTLRISGRTALFNRVCRRMLYDREVRSVRPFQ